MFADWGSLVYRFRWVVLAGSLLVFVGLGAVASHGGQLHEEDSISTQASQADALARATLPRQPDHASFVLVFSSSALRVQENRFRVAMDTALVPLSSDHRVLSIVTPYEGGGNALISADQHSAIASVTLSETSEQAQDDYSQLRGLVRSSVLSVKATGSLAAEADFTRLTNDGLSRAESVALPISLLILIVAFGGILAALLPIAVGIMTITAGAAITFLIARGWGVDSGATELIALLGLALAIDYSLFVVSRFREELARSADVLGALRATTATATRSIVFSGLTVMAGLSGLFFFRGTWLGTVVAPMISVVAVAIVFNLTFLTALLAILGKRVDWLRLPIRRLSEPGVIWRRIANAVMHRPALFLVPALAAISVVALPIFQIKLATDHIAMLPKSAESRQAAELLSSQFAAQGQSSEELVVDFNAAGGSSASQQVTTLEQRISLLPTVTNVNELAMRNRVAVLDVESNAIDHSDAARQLVRQLRAQKVGGGSILVGGATAGDMDRTAAILARVPLAVGAVAGLSYLVLFLLLGSVILPLKAVVTNLLSMTASFGAIVWIFQEGHLASWLGFTPGPIDPTLPVLLFALLFGLSMDYEVFLLSRIQEEYRRTGDNRAAVGFGLQRNGRLVTFAALIMVAVFGAFGLSDVVVFKAAGIGASLAVLVDATLVRGVIVPSLMVLMGRLNWWAPRRLRRLVGRFADAQPSQALYEQAVQEAVA